MNQQFNSLKVLRKDTTFKIDVKRVDKSFPLDTYTLQREVGARY